MSEMFVGNKPEATQPEGRRPLLDCLPAAHRLEMWDAWQCFELHQEEEEVFALSIKL